MANNTEIPYGNYTEAEPYEGDCCPPNYWVCQKEPGMTFQEYATCHKLTYEGVRRKVLKYKSALIPHIKIRSGTQYLDDIAVDFLERHGRKKTVKSEIIEINELTTLRQKVDSLTKENNALKTQCQDLTKQLSQITEKCNDLYDLCDSQWRENVKLSTELLMKDRRSQRIIDTQFQMLREAHVLTPEKIDILFDAMNWDGTIEQPKTPPDFSLDDTDES